MSRYLLIFLVLAPAISFAESSVTLLDESTNQAVSATAKVKFVIHVKERISLEVRKKAGKVDKVAADSNVPGLVIDNTSNTIAIP